MVAMQELNWTMADRTDGGQATDQAERHRSAVFRLGSMRKPLRLPPGKVGALFIDLQEEHRGDARFLAVGYDSVLANVQRLQASARQHGVPLYHCAYAVDTGKLGRRLHPTLADGRSVFSDSSDPLTAICPEVAPLAGETLLLKSQASAFGSVSPEDDLHLRGIEWLVVAGVWTEACVDQTVRDAVMRGFRVLLVKDACGSGSDAMHRTAVLNLANRLYGGAIADTATACRLLAGEAADAWQLEGAVPIRFAYDTADDFYDAL